MKLDIYVIAYAVRDNEKVKTAVFTSYDELQEGLISVLKPYPESEEEKEDFINKRLPKELFSDSCGFIAVHKH